MRHSAIMKTRSPSRRQQGRVSTSATPAATQARHCLSGAGFFQDGSADALGFRVAGVGDGLGSAVALVGGAAGAAGVDGRDVVEREAEGEADDGATDAVCLAGASGRGASAAALLSSDETDRSNNHVPPAPPRRTRTAAIAVREPVSAYRAGFRRLGALGGSGGADPW
ncbi:hypothetical protein CLM62_22240 [Streptomyces sp. SA15]|nr:hypothetical protein CLM62_22240 [Streptomyces sp. SA15]